MVPPASRRVLVGCCYLDYPDNQPDDVTDARTLAYISIADDNDRNLASTYSVDICTFRYMERNYIQKNEILFLGNLILVPTLSDEWILSFLESNIPQIEAIGHIV